MELFPFLAVLVCTMGALIFLLLVTTRMIRDRATASSLAEAVSTAPQLPLLSVVPPMDDQLPPPAPPVPIFSEPEAPPDPDEPVDDAIDVRAIARQQRQQELDALVQQWQGRVDGLRGTRDEHARLLAQRQQLQRAAAERTEAMHDELLEMEIKLGRMTGELSTPASTKSTSKERIELENQIKELKRRLRAAQQPQNEDKFEVVPFDVVSGTSRRPILIECTATGLRFIPEDITVSPNDLAGFSPQVNPLIVGAGALVNYWTAWNIRQPKPTQEPEPYVLLLVRPSGTIAYYVAMKMLSELKQPHGYELLEEDTVLQPPPVDAGAKAACETAIKRLLAERNQILRQAGMGGIGAGRGGGRGIGGTGGGGRFGEDSGDSGTDSSGPGDSMTGAGAGAGSDSLTSGSGGSDSGEFELADIMDKGDVGNRSWERVENFEGPRRGGSSLQNAAQKTAQNGPRGSPREGTGIGSGTGSGSFAVTAGKSSADVPGKGTASRPGTVPSTNETGPPSGIETLDKSDNVDPAGVADPSQPGTNALADTGLGSAGNRTIPVEDRRGQKKKSTDRDKLTEPEQLVGRHWGLSEPGSAIGLEREVRIDVETRRYVLSKKHAVAIDESDSREDTFVKLVTVLDLQARDWGTPPQGFFWKPSLRYVIADGGDANYERVHSLLERAGLSSSREYADQQPPATVATPEPPKPPMTTLTPAPAEPKPPRRFFRGILR